LCLIIYYIHVSRWLNYYYLTGFVFHSTDLCIYLSAISDLLGVNCVVYLLVIDLCILELKSMDNYIGFILLTEIWINSYCSKYWKSIKFQACLKIKLQLSLQSLMLLIFNSVNILFRVFHSKWRYSFCYEKPLLERRWLTADN
jgi:hypothetical protein